MPSRIFSSPFNPSKPRSNSKLRIPCIVQNLLKLCSQGPAHLKQAVDSSLPLLARKGIRLNSKVLASIIQSCANYRLLQQGKCVHLHLKLTGLKHPNTFLCNHLIHMYARCGDHDEARRLFDKMRVKNLYSWNNMLSGYADLGMVKPARRLFDKMPERDCVSWNTMINAYAQNGYFNEAVRFYRDLRGCGIGCNEYSFSGVITISVKLMNLKLVKQMHCQIFLVGFQGNVVLSSSLVNAYAKCGELGDARRLFDEMGRRDTLAWTTLVSGYAQWGDMRSARELFDLMPEKNSVSWNALIAGYAQNGCGNEAIGLFSKMIKLGSNPHQPTISDYCLCPDR